MVTVTFYPKSLELIILSNFPPIIQRHTLAGSSSLSFIFARTTTLKASLISHRSTCCAFIPVCLSNLSTANLGAMGKSTGSVAPSAYPTILHVRLNRAQETSSVQCDPILRATFYPKKIDLTSEPTLHLGCTCNQV